MPLSVNDSTPKSLGKIAYHHNGQPIYAFRKLIYELQLFEGAKFLEEFWLKDGTEGMWRIALKP